MNNITTLINDLKTSLKQSIEMAKKLEKKYSFKPSNEKLHDIVHSFSSDLVDLEMTLKFDHKLFTLFNSICVLVKDEQLHKILPLQAFVSIFVELQKISFSELYDDLVARLQDIQDRNTVRQIHKIKQLENFKVSLDTFDSVIKNCSQTEEQELFGGKTMLTLDEKIRSTLLRHYMASHKNLSAMCNMLEKLYSCLHIDGKTIIDNCYGSHNSSHSNYPSHGMNYMHNSIYG